MNLNEIETKCYILALFIRDDGERFLLGDGQYEFNDRLQHFKPNTFQNDVVELQGADGQLLAGQVRRSASQPFDGYIGDATIAKTATEQRRQDFLMFFRKKHFYTVVYIFPDGSAVQRQRGYIVDAPSVPEMWQRFPEYHVALNFEDPNYYEYAEDDLGDEVYANVEQIRLAIALEGGLIWDADGAISLPLSWDGTTVSGTGTAIALSNTIKAPFGSLQANGDTAQQTYTGRNLLSLNVYQPSTNSANVTLTHGINDLKLVAASTTGAQYAMVQIDLDASTTYTLSGNAKKIVKGTDGRPWLAIRWRGSNDNGSTWTAYADMYSNSNPTQGTSYSFGNHFTGYKRYQILFYNNVNTPVTIGETTEYSQLQLEVGSTVSAFEPYVGSTPSFITPSPNPDYPQDVNVVTGRQEVRITGKNIHGGYPGGFSVDNRSGVDFVSNADGTISANGTATDNNALSMYLANAQSAGWVRTYPAGTYTLSGGNSKIIVYFSAADGSTSYQTSVSTGTRTFTLSEPHTAYIRIQVRSGETVNETVSPQLEFGSTATQYEPYNGQAYEINLGKNLMPMSVADLQTSRSEGFYMYLPAGTYTVSYDLVSLTLGTNTTFRLNMALFGANNTQLIDVNLSENFSSASVPGHRTATFTIDQDASINSQSNIRIGQTWWNNGARAYLENIQIEAGNYATNYAPYSANPIELCKIGTYQDYIWNDNGTWKIHKAINKVTLDGSNDESWSVSQSGTANFLYVNSGIPAYAQANGAISNYFTRTNITSANTDVGFTPINNTTLRFRPNFAELSLTDWKSWLSTHNTNVYYALATATDTAITDQALLAQLEALKSAGTKKGVTSIIVTAVEMNLATPLNIIGYTSGSIDDSGYEWEDGGGGGINTVSVAGIDDARPIWTVDGPATNPTLTNITTGQTISWLGTVPNGQQLIVDMGNMTAKLAGANVFEYITGEWVRLAPGNNGITYNALNTNNQPSTLSWNGVVG